MLLPSPYTEKPRFLKTRWGLTSRHKWNWGLEDLSFPRQTSLFTTDGGGPEGPVACLTCKQDWGSPGTPVALPPHPFIIKFFALNAPPWPVNQRQLTRTLEALTCSEPGLRGGGGGGGHTPALIRKGYRCRRSLPGEKLQLHGVCEPSFITSQEPAGPIRNSRSLCGRRPSSPDDIQPQPGCASKAQKVCA